MAAPVRLPNLLIAIAIGAMLVGVLHLVYEALMLTVFGTTIGKSVFGLRVETRRGKKAEFSRLFRRSLGAWLWGSYAYVLFPLATLFAWKKSYDEFRLNGRTYWDKQSKTRVIGAVLPMWHLSAGAALAIGAFGMVLMSLTAGRADNAAPATSRGQPMPPPADAAESAAPASAAAAANSAQIGAIQNGNAVFLANSAQKSFAIKAPPARPSASKSAEELAIWAERTLPYFVADGPERRAMFAWMIAGTRVGLPRGAALALGIDTVFSGRENGSGVCWPAELPPDRMPKEIASSPEKVVLGVRCER
jgi:RDD family